MRTASPHSVGDAVTHADELDLQRAETEPVARADGSQHRLLVQTEFAKFLLNQAERKRRTVHGNRKSGQQVREPARMILVPVGEDDASNPLALRQQVGRVRENQVNSQHLLLGEHEAGVNDQDVLGSLEEGHVHPDLTQPPQGDDADPRRVRCQDVRDPPKPRVVDRSLRQLRTPARPGCRATHWRDVMSIRREPRGVAPVAPRRHPQSAALPRA